MQPGHGARQNGPSKARAEDVLVPFAQLLDEGRNLREVVGIVGVAHDNVLAARRIEIEPKKRSAAEIANRAQMPVHRKTHQLVCIRTVVECRDKDVACRGVGRDAFGIADAVGQRREWNRRIAVQHQLIGGLRDADTTRHRAGRKSSEQ